MISQEIHAPAQTRTAQKYHNSPQDWIILNKNIIDIVYAGQQGRIAVGKINQMDLNRLHGPMDRALIPGAS